MEAAAAWRHGGPAQHSDNNADELEELLKDKLESRTHSAGNPEHTLLKQFKNMDVNCDERVSLAEFRKVVERVVVGAQDDQIQALFHKWDADDSGFLDAREFVGALFKSPEERETIRRSREAERDRSRSSSLLADDIIEQARRNRAARKVQVKKTTAKERRVEEIEDARRSAARQKHPPRQFNPHLGPAADHRRRAPAKECPRGGPMRGPFQAGKPLTSIPDVVRYRVSKTDVSVRPPAEWDAKLASVQLRRSAELPGETLELEFAHGQNPRAGLFAGKNGELVYATAGLGVVYDAREHKQRFFTQHINDVTCVAVDPSGRYAATGTMAQARPRHPAEVLVWDLETLEVVGRTEPGYYDREICAVAFAPSDPSILVAIGADNHHMMGVWQWNKGRLLAEMPVQNGEPNTLRAMVFDDECKAQHRFVTCGLKHVKFWRFDSDAGKLLGGRLATYGNVSRTPRETLCAAFLAGNVAVTGGSNGTMYLWDAETYVCRRAIPAHEGPVSCLLVAANHTLLSGGGKDQAIRFWGTQNAAEGSGAFRKLDQIQLPAAAGSAAALALIPRGRATPVLAVATTSGALVSHLAGAGPEPWKTFVGGHCRDVYGLATHPGKPAAFCTVGDDARLCIWDAVSRQLIQSVPLPGPARAVDISSRGRNDLGGSQYIAVGATSGAFAVLESDTLKVVFTATHCREQVSQVRFSPGGGLLAVASNDNDIHVYDVDAGFQHQCRLRGHSSFVTHLDWSEDGTMLQSNCGAHERLLWDVQTGKQITKGARNRDGNWETHTCVLGFDVMGIWPESADGTDVNAAARSPDQRLLATGDDDGRVKLFNYPVLVGKAPNHAFAGHSSHVTNVRWLSGGDRLLSTGGHDRAVLQWRRVRLAQHQQ